MKVLIVGGAGYIGGTTAQLFNKAGHDVTVLDNLSTGHRHNIKNLLLIEGDCGNLRLLDQLFADATFDVVLHFAAKIRVDESMEQPLKYFQNNTFDATTLIDAVSQAGIKNFIFSSTAAVYSGSGAEPIAEGQRVEPVNPYGHSKHLTEQLLASYQQTHNLNWLAFRFFNAAGSHDRIGPDYPFLTQVIPNIIRASLHDTPFKVFGTDYDTIDGSAVRDFIHVDDIAQAHLLAAEKMMAGQAIQRPVNIGSQSGYSVLQLIKMVERVTGKPITVQPADRRPGDSAAIVANTQLARQLLDWQPQCDLEKIITDAVNWQRRYRAE